MVFIIYAVINLNIGIAQQISIIIIKLILLFVDDICQKVTDRLANNV